MTESNDGLTATGRRRRPTMADVAAAAGVSKGLVSMILSGAPGPSAATTERVLAIAGQLGYRADRTAAMLARRRTRLIGVTSIPSNVFHGELVEEIQALAAAQGYDVVLGSIDGAQDERQAIEMLIGFRCEAILLLGPGSATEEIVPFAQDVAIVAVGSPLDVPEIDCIRADDNAGIHELVDHLVALGHRRIVHIDGAGSASDIRRAAYLDAMERHGLSSQVIAAGGLTEAHGTAAAQQLDLSEVTAVVCFNDRTALGVLDFLDEAGVAVPGRISVTGYDDSLIARLRRISLTSVNQSPIEQARLALEMVVERLDADRTESRRTVLPAQVVLRGSTGPARGRAG
ncbi:MAG: LacI family DNA-binding transcriptional regulator [Kineosporiaceae bacterium]